MRADTAAAAAAATERPRGIGVRSCRGFGRDRTGAVFLWSALLNHGNLTVAMPPLQWPGVDFGLVAAAALLAAPALVPVREADE